MASRHLPTVTASERGWLHPSGFIPQHVKRNCFSTNPLQSVHVSSQRVWTHPAHTDRHPFQRGPQVVPPGKLEDVITSRLPKPAHVSEDIAPASCAQLPGDEVPVA
ncbi:unnamed protein product [Periconia digitata]|uniref:Uncharacterized protein n=1 Tax=Periconia digitata TaxID=1303443 RepID=A0A9W4XEM1_9PLEO|nr:unnamed protein product [Periconia digitata]